MGPQADGADKGSTCRATAKNPARVVVPSLVGWRRVGREAMVIVILDGRGIWREALDAVPRVVLRVFQAAVDGRMEWK